VAQAPDDAGGAAIVDLPEPGARPRTPLRISAPAGSVSTATMRQGVSIIQTVNGQKQSPKAVEVSAGLRMTVTQVDADGRRTITFAYEFPPGTDPATQQSLEQFESQLDSLATPFPAEPVGKGARWKVTQHPEVNGLSTTQDIVYTLKQRDGDQITLRMEVGQKAAPQEVSSAAMPANTTARLTKSSGKGAGDITLDLTKVLPDESRASLSIVQVIDIEQGSQSARVKQTVSSNVTITGT
jgi:hypothetical protein